VTKNELDKRLEKSNLGGSIVEIETVEKMTDSLGGNDTTCTDHGAKASFGKESNREEHV
jgi:hypothetical protein